MNIKEFKQYLEVMGYESTTEKELEHLHTTSFTIRHEDKETKIPFTAVSWNAFLDLISTIEGDNDYDNKL